MDKLKDRIKKERLKKELNQPQLAKIMSVSKQTVSNWENGNRIPDTLTLSKLADFFGCSVDYLLGKTDLEESSNFFHKQNQKYKTKNQTNFSSMLENELKKANLYNENMKPEEKLLLANKILNILKLIDNK